MSQSEYWTEFMRRRLSRRHLLGAGAAAGIGLWAGSTLSCSSGGTPAKPSETGQGAETPQKGGTMRITLALAEPGGTDPYVTRHFAGPAYEHLVYYNQKRDKIVPRLAESWEISDDTTYVFKLKKGVKFHNLPPVNGREMTAEDAKWSVERLLTDAPNFSARPFFTVLDKIEAVDKYTLKLTTKTPFAPLMGNLAYSGRDVMPKEIIGSDGIATAVIGTGPFIFDRWDRGEKMVWKRNPDYHVADQPYLDGIEYKWAADYTALVAIFVSDQADMVTIYGQDTKTILQKRPNCQMQQAASLAWHNFIFRSGFKPTDDLRVRQAMDLMVPRWEVAYRVLGNTGELFGGSAVGPIPGALENWALPMSELQKRIPYMEKYPKAEALAQAKKLMAEAGYADGFDVTIAHTFEPYRELIIQMAQDWWKEIGIRSTIKPMDASAFVSAGIKGDFQMLFYTSGGDPDPDAMLYNILRSGSVNNWGRWSDSVLDKMLDDQRTTLDPAKRKAIVLDAQRRILDQLPRLYIYDWSTFTAVRENVRGFQVNHGATFSGWEWLGQTWFAK